MLGVSIGLELVTLENYGTVRRVSVQCLFRSGRPMGAILRVCVMESFLYGVGICGDVRDLWLLGVVLVCTGERRR